MNQDLVYTTKMDGKGDAPTSNPATKFFFHKWASFISMYLGYTLLILCRKSFSFALPAVVASNLNLNKDDLGLIASSQNLAYTISKFLGGILSDQTSPNLLFSAGLALSGIFTVGFTGFNSATGFAVIWFLQGFMQGGAWPACAKVLQAWMPPEEFGSMWSILSSSMNVACTVGPLLATSYFGNSSWQVLLQTFGLASMIMSIVSFLFIVDSPKDIGFQSFADTADSKTKSPTRGRGTWQDMLSSTFMRVLCGSYLVVFMARTAALDWAQLYLINELGQAPFTGSSFISALETGGFIGTIVAGYAADRMVAMRKREDARGTPRMTVVMAFLGLCIFSIFCMLFTVSSSSSHIWIALIGFLLGFGLYGPISLYGVMAVEAAPSHLTGMSHSLVALAANIGAIVAGLPFSVIATYFNWRGAFMFLEVLLIAVLGVTVSTRNVEYKVVCIKKKLQ